MFKQLKITYLLESTTLWGGTKVAFEQAEALADAGHQVSILSKDTVPTWYPLKLPIIQVTDFNASTIPDSDVIVGTYWTTVKAAYESGRGMLVHLCQGYEGDYSELSHLKAVIEEVYSYKIPKLTISLHLDRFLKERFDSETHYIGQMLNKDIFYPISERKWLNPLKLLGISPIKILVVGPFEVDFKNIPTALKGISLAEKRFKVPLKITRVSQFPLTKEEEKIKKPDKYYFHLPHNEMGDIYRKADLFISMSKEAEGFGLPAIEAMACGIPTILSKISSYTSFDEIQDYSLFIESSDHESLAKAISELFRNKQLREQFMHRGVAVAGKFSKEDVVNRLNVAFEAILYSDNLSKTEKAWNDYHFSQKSGSKIYWWDSPVILEHCQKLITGDPKTDFYQFIKNEFVRNPLGRGLSICSGSGEFERGLLNKNICRSIDAYEIAEVRAKEGMKAAQEKGYAINFFIEDVNKATFKKDFYDIFISWSALHHIENLEGVCENTHTALRKGGLLIIQEYIGPNQFQWTDSQLEIINKLLHILPERLRINQKTGEMITHIKRPTIEYMNSTDPSEAIRSKDIMPILEKFFDIKIIRYFGGSVFNPLFNAIIGNFNHDDERDIALINIILLLEKILIEQKILENDYAVIIAEKI